MINNQNICPIFKEKCFSKCAWNDAETGICAIFGILQELYKLNIFLEKITDTVEEKRKN